jgi:hypothetical protein
MPIDKAKMQKLIDAMDNYFKQKEQDQLNGIDDDDDDDDFLNPSDAPPNAPFSDGAQQKPKRDLFK